jgi:hypothetical protein
MDDIGTPQLNELPPLWVLHEIRSNNREFNIRMWLKNGAGPD